MQQLSSYPSILILHMSSICGLLFSLPNEYQKSPAFARTEDVRSLTDICTSSVRFVCHNSFTNFLSSCCGTSKSFLGVQLDIQSRTCDSSSVPWVAPLVACSQLSLCNLVILGGYLGTSPRKLHTKGTHWHIPDFLQCLHCCFHFGGLSFACLHWDREDNGKKCHWNVCK